MTVRVTRVGYGIVDRMIAVGAMVVLAPPSCVRRPATSEAAPDDAGRPSSVKLLEGGYAIGPAREIEKVIRASVQGTRTACESPPPTAEERADWKQRHATPEPKKMTFADRVVDLRPHASVPMSVLLKGPDLDLAEEVEWRLDDEVFGGRGFVGLTREEQNVYLVNTLEGEVENGGVDQFFSNSSGNCALRTAEALKELGFVTELAAFRKALALFPDGNPSEDRSTRFAQLEAIGSRRDAWEKLDKNFEGLAGYPVADYVRKHTSAFVLPP
jgi:hypothetical protein